METSKNIYQRISAVQAEVNYIQRDASVSTGGGAYKAVTHDAVIALLRGPMNKHGIQPTISLIEAAFDPKEEGSKQRLFRATFVVAFVNVDKPEESMNIVVPAHAMDNSDKAPGKALSYAFKMALLKTFCLETGESDESVRQIGDYDFGMALLMAQDTDDAATAREIIQEARAAAVKAKDAQAAKDISAVSKKLAEKFRVAK